MSETVIQSHRLTTNLTSTIPAQSHSYGLPANYNPADHPPVKLRHHNHSDQSETQRKRRSKNRLSNRRSTGYVPPEILEEAIKIGDKKSQN